jgi:hypothetical protein
LMGDKIDTLREDYEKMKKRNLSQQ